MLLNNYVILWFFFFLKKNADLKPLKNVLDVNVAQTSKISKEIAALKEMMVKQGEKLDQILVMNQKILNLLGDLDKGNSSTITTEDKVYSFFRHFLLDIFSDFLCLIYFPTCDYYFFLLYMEIFSKICLSIGYFF